MPFFLSLPLAFLVAAVIGLVLERTLYVHVYRKQPSRPGAVHDRPRVHGGGRQSITSWARRSCSCICRTSLQGQFNVFGVGIGRYRLLIIVVCGLLALGLQFILTHTRFGSRLRAAVDDQRVARGLGINVSGIFALTFAFGSGLAGLGGALGAEILGLDPTFPLKYMIYFLIVVTVGGTSSITGPFLASILLGIADVAGKYYVPKLGAFVIYTIMIVVLIWRPQGPVLARGGEVRRPWMNPSLLRRATESLRARARWTPLEIIFWLVAFAMIWLLPTRHLILTEIALLGPVRAVARSHPRLCRHHLARPRRVFRLRRLCGGAAGETRTGQRAGAGAADAPGWRRRCSASSPASWCCAAPI